jgi:chromosome segregation ATPase
MRRALLLTVLLAVAATNAMAQSASETETDRLRDALRGAIAQVRALEDERAALDARASEAEREAVSLRAQVDAAKAEAAQADKDYRQAVSDFNSRLDERNKTLEKWRSAYEEAATVARTKDADRAKFEGEYNAYKARTTSCETKNANLVKVDHDAVAAYRDLGVIKRIGATEPFTGLGTVMRQNRAQDLTDGIIQNTQP